MNVNDISDYMIPTPSPEKDRLDLIYERQAVLMAKYHVIEEENGLLHVTGNGALNLHDRHCQARLKDHAWRVTEELAEAHEAWYIHGRDHFIEELSDAYHFLMELNIQCGITSNDLVLYGMAKNYIWEGECRLVGLFNNNNHPVEEEMLSPKVPIAEVVMALGTAMNCLKNKPWKQTHILTDETKFKRSMGYVNRSFIQLCSDAGLDADSLFRVYFKKSEVNKFRQRSKY